MNPFEDFLPQLYCPTERKIVEEGHCNQDYVGVLNPFFPTVSLSYSEDRCVNAHVEELSFPLYTIDDLLRWTSMRQKGADESGLITNVQGYLGENLLSLMMDSFLQEVTKKSPLCETAEIGVLRETGKAKGRGYAARFNNNYLLRFKLDTSFVLIGKGEAASSEVAYMQEKLGMVYTEIDGLGYLVTNGQKHLLIGESSTKKEFRINSWERGKGIGESFEDRVFSPLLELLPKHKLTYFIMAHPRTIFDPTHQPFRLKKDPQIIYSHLKKKGINTLFIPIPQIKPSLTEIAKEVTINKIPLIRAVFKDLLKKYLPDEEIND